jgi:DNA adenine methylase
MTEMNSPIRYPGGKFYARKIILDYLPNHQNYVEPFSGGASIFFAKNKVKKNWLNDRDDELMNCFIHIRDHANELINRLSGEKATKERHKFYKDVYEPKTDLDKASRWYYLNRTSYSGIMQMKNCYWGYGDKYSMRPENWPRNILRTSSKLQDVILSTRDFSEILDDVEDNSFLFIDPPYFNADQDKFYTRFFTRSDHNRLCECLKKHSKRIKFLLTYDDCYEIHDMYSWTGNLLSKEWNYTLNRTDDQKHNSKRKGTRYKGKELFIMNYELKQIMQQMELSLPINIAK